MTNLTKLILLYTIVGAVVTAAAATISGTFYSFWLSIGLSLLYFIGLFIVIRVCIAR